MMQPANIRLCQRRFVAQIANLIQVTSFKQKPQEWLENQWKNCCKVQLTAIFKLPSDKSSRDVMLLLKPLFLFLEKRVYYLLFYQSGFELKARHCSRQKPIGHRIGFLLGQRIRNTTPQWS